MDKLYLKHYTAADGNNFPLQTATQILSCNVETFIQSMTMQ